MHLQKRHKGRLWVKRDDTFTPLLDHVINCLALYVFFTVETTDRKPKSIQFFHLSHWITSQMFMVGKQSSFLLLTRTWMWMINIIINFVSKDMVWFVLFGHFTIVYISLRSNKNRQERASELERREKYIFICTRNTELTKIHNITN